MSEAPTLGNLRESKSRKRRSDNRERIRRIATIRSGIGQRSKDLAYLIERSGPTVRKDDWERVGPNALLKHKVNRVVFNAVSRDRRRELRHRIQFGLLGTPVEVSAPVLAKLLHVGEIRAVLPAGIGDLRRPARLGQPPVQVLDLRVGDSNLKWVRHGVLPWSG